jgi:tetratricopeptide (TPR) repeat protein
MPILTRKSGRDGEAVPDWNEKNKALVALINAGRIEEALAPAQELVAYVDRRFRRDSKKKATTYNNMGMVFMLSGDYELAEECFRDALEMRKRIFGRDHQEVAVILLNMAHLYKLMAGKILKATSVETEAD